MYAVIAKLVQPVAKPEPTLKESLAVLKKHGFMVTEIQAQADHYGMMAQQMVYKGQFQLVQGYGSILDSPNNVAQEILAALGGY